MIRALPPAFRTVRLLAQRLDERHLDDLARLYAEPAVIEWFGGGATRDEIREWLATTVRPHWDERGFGLYAFYEALGREDDRLGAAAEAGADAPGADAPVGRPSESRAAAFVGRASLKLAAPDVRDQLGEPQAVELLYALMPGKWGRGYATEIGRALAGFGLAELGLEGLIAYALPENVRSRRVLEKCDFTEEGRIVHEGLGHVLFRRRRG